MGTERQRELRRRHHRKKKMRKLKAKYAAAPSNADKAKILEKIHQLSPWWEPPKEEAAAS